MNIAEQTTTTEAELLCQLVHQIAGTRDPTALHTLRESLSAGLSAQTRRWLPDGDAYLVHEATLYEVWTLARHHLDEDVATWASQIAARRITERLHCRVASGIDEHTAAMLAANDERAALDCAV